MDYKDSSGNILLKGLETIILSIIRVGTNFYCNFIF